jgi:hypothetical protein
VHQFEALVGDATVPTCPSCQCESLERLMSLFGVSSERTQQSALQSARRKSARAIRGQQIADREYKLKHEH